MIGQTVTAWHNTRWVAVELDRPRPDEGPAKEPGRRNVARHVCPECGATVTGVEQFCPTCGTFLDYDEEPAGSNDYEQFELGAVPPPPEDFGPRSREIPCPSCGALNAPGNRHCEECGARLSQGPLPAAPRPAVQATAGVRAVIAIGGLLLGVIIIALLFQLFGGSSPTDTTTAAADGSTTSTTEIQPAVLDPLDVSCSVEGLGSFVCNNLISGTEATYQVKWPDLEASGEKLSITIRFRTAVAISRIDWKNLAGDETRFKRNYKARALTISSDDSVVDVQRDLENSPGVQQIPFSSLNTNQVTITVNSVWDAELVDGNVFTELAIDEIQVIGRPAETITPTESTTPAETTTP